MRSNGAPKVASTTDAASRAPGPNPRKEGCGPDVEGLRAVAVAAVLLCHAGMPFAGGGYVRVDVSSSSRDS